VIVRQGSSHRLDVVTEGIQTAQLNAKRPSETELYTEQVRSRRKVALIPNSQIKVLHKPWSAHKNSSHVILTDPPNSRRQYGHSRSGGTQVRLAAVLRTTSKL